MAEQLEPSDTGACGSNKGYARHRRRGQRACEACRQAHNRATALHGRIRRAKEARGRILMPCGTPPAYERHRRKGEPIDEACRRANADRVKPYNRRAAAQRKREKAARERALARLADRYPLEFYRMYQQELSASRDPRSQGGVQ